LSTGSIDLLNPAFAAKNLGLGTVVAHPVAYSLFAMVYLWRQRVVGAWVCCAYLVAALLALFAQKVRFISAYSAVLLLLLLVARLSLKRAVPWLIAGGFLASCAIAIVATSDTGPITATVVKFATLDTGGQDFSDLSGRAELWAELQHYVDARPVLGYG